MKSYISLFAAFGVMLSLMTPFDAAGATINASSCSQADVTAALSSASSGDTVAIPAGSCTWSVLNIGKGITLTGAGIDVTNVSCGGGACAETFVNSVRISGFTFANCDHCLVMRGVNWRVDNNKFSNTSHSAGVRARGEVDRVQPSGLIDHNIFIHTTVHSIGTAAQRTEGDYQDSLWTQDPGFGTAKGMYVEDNYFANAINSVDCNYGGNYVYRFNTVTNSYLEAHSVQGNNRACQRWEIYNNVFTDTTWVVAFLRGGSGYMFGNTNNNDNPIALNNVRDTESRETAGICDGASNWDQNVAGLSGYACRDQIGRSIDAVKWTTGAPYNQPLTPAYIWDNVTSFGGGQQIQIDLHFPSNPAHIVANRDFYTHNAAFDGTSGVGSGPLSARPSTCTAGVGYWATDQGNWNSNGPSGVLYKCSTANTWVVGYVPFQYPHPLASGGGIALLPAPTNLRVVQ